MEKSQSFWKSLALLLAAAIVSSMIMAAPTWSCDPRSVSPGSCAGGAADVCGAPIPFMTDETDVYSAPVNCDGANLEGPNCHPSVTADGQWLFFEYDRDPLGLGGLDIYMATANGAGWNTPVNLGPPVNSQWHEGKPTVTPDGSALYFQATRPGGLGGSDIYVSSWTGSGWGMPQNLGSPVNSNYDESTPYISYDGQRLYFQTTNRPGGPGGGDLWLSRRAGAIWGTPAPLPPPLNTPTLEWYCCESPDSSELYIISSRAGGYGNIDLWRSVRQASGLWGPVLVVPAPVNTSNAICSPYMAADGRLFFGGWLEGGYGDLDVWWTQWTADDGRSSSLGSWELPQIDDWGPGISLSGATVVLSLCKTSSGTILAGTYPNGAVYCSTNGGLSWSDPILLPGAMRVFRFLQTTSRTIIATSGMIFASTYPNGDVFRSSNDGQTWVNCANIPQATEARALLQTSDGRIYVGCAPQAKIYWSNNNGNTWNVCGALGAQATSMIYELVQDVHGRIYAGAWSAASLFYSDNGGSTWLTCADYPIESLWYAPQAILCIGDTVYAGCWVHGLENTNGRIFRSDDRGTTWQQTQLISGSSDVWELMQNPDGEISATVGTMASGEIVYNSSNQGASWISTGGCQSVREGFSLLRLDDGTLLVGTAPGGKIFRNESPVQLVNPPLIKHPLYGFPSPFNSWVNLTWEGGSELKSLGIYDLAGRLVKTLRTSGAQLQKAVWDGKNEAGEQVSGGIYLCKAQAEGQQAVLKLVYMK